MQSIVSKTYLKLLRLHMPRFLLYSTTSHYVYKWKNIKSTQRLNSTEFPVTKNDLTICNFINNICNIALYGMFRQAYFLPRRYTEAFMPPIELSIDQEPVQSFIARKLCMFKYNKILYWWPNHTITGERRGRGTWRVSWLRVWRKKSSFSIFTGLCL